MSTTTGKVDEQDSDASKPQQNGHERNKNELQLDDINDNNNDEVIFSRYFLACRCVEEEQKIIQTCAIIRDSCRRSDQYVRVESDGVDRAVNLQTRYHFICDT